MNALSQQPAPISSLGIPPKWRRLPYEPCVRCGADGWDPENPDRLCQKCGGDRFILNLPWTTRKVRAQVRFKMSPTEVRTLRSLGCPVSEYPLEGTPEWAEFDTADKQAKAARIERMRLALLEKWGPGGPPRRHARRVGK